MPADQQPWKTPDWFSSPWNFEPAVTSGLRFADRIEVHDTTLRDGEQQAGVIFSAAEKVRIAHELADAGVHRIEAGMPAVSPEDEKAIRTIVNSGLPSTTYVLSRCMRDDILRAVDCGVDGVVVEIPSSRHLIELGYRWTVERATELCVEATGLAHREGLKVSFFPVDATRALRMEYVDLIGTVAREGHVDAIGLVDTFGVLAPHAVELFVEESKRFGVPLETHFHMDFSLGVANTLLALGAGASVIHTTVSGLGERAGNTPLEETVMALLTMYRRDIGIKTEHLSALSRTVNELAGITQPPNRPVVGKTLFDIESGMVAGWVVNARHIDLTEVVPYRPSLVGQTGPAIVLGKGSGPDSVKDALDQLGMEADDALVRAILPRVKEAAIACHRLITLDEFAEIASSVAEARAADGAS
jgi:isopropylmalate/homocitrate/citramalate synthase